MSIGRRHLVAAGAAAIGSATAARAQQRIAITFMHYQTGTPGKILRALLDAFQAENPDVEVRDVFRQSEQITAELQVVRRIGENQVDRPRRQAVHHLDAVAAKDLVQRKHGCLRRFGLRHRLPLPLRLDAVLLNTG
jgi:hypothetical protein